MPGGALCWGNMQLSLHAGLSSMRFANPDAGFGSLLRDYGMLAPPSAALLLIDVTAQQDDPSASCLVRAARARPRLVDKGVSHHSCHGYTALRGRKPLNSRPCCRVADDEPALDIGAPLLAYPRMSSQLVSDSNLRPMANCILIFVCYPQWSSTGTVRYGP